MEEFPSPPGTRRPLVNGGYFFVEIGLDPDLRFGTSFGSWPSVLLRAGLLWQELPDEQLAEATYIRLAHHPSARPMNHTQQHSPSACKKKVPVDGVFSSEITGGRFPDNLFFLSIFGSMIPYKLFKVSHLRRV